MITINMKQYLFILLSFLLASCAEQEIGREEPGGIPGEGFRLSVRLGNGIATRALGDPFNSAGDEKRIDRLAFFVHTDEDGFQVYPPVPDDVTDATAAATDHPHNVYLTETAPGSGQYTADVTLTAGGGYMADIVAVANLPKDYDYDQIVTWDGLQDSVAVWATANLLPATAGTATEMPSCTPGANLADPARRAFAMYGYTREELVKEETNAFTLALERLVARIDITNEAYEPGMTAADPKGGFLLTSVRVLQARPASYITPQPGYASPDVATISDWQVTDIPYGKATASDATANPTREPDAVDAAAAETDATLQYLWRTLYTYENSDTEHAPTALEIKGNFRGTEVTRRIDFIDADKQPVPLVRNHRYLVRILPAPGQTDITFDIKVAEWDAVDTVQVKPDQTEVPEIAKIDGNGVYVEKTKRYDAYYSAPGEITFDATCNFAPDVRVKYDDPKQSNWISIERSEPELTTKATNIYKRHFKITFPKMEHEGTRYAMLLIHNGGSEVECDTIFIRQTEFYPGTDLKGVVLPGEAKLWAPVNIGATRKATNVKMLPYSPSEEEIQDYFEQVGYYFQWGRKSGVKCNISKTPYVMGPIPLDDENKEGYQNKLIALNGDPEKQSWATTSDATLWNCGTEENPSKGKNDPCPAGWRTPSSSELAKLFNKVCSDNNNLSNNIWQSTDFPIALPIGGISYFAFSSVTIQLNTTLCLWSSSPSDADTAVMLQKNKSLPWGKATATPIRCVEE